MSADDLRRALMGAMCWAYVMGFESSREGMNGEHGKRPEAWYENRDQQIRQYLEDVEREVRNCLRKGAQRIPTGDEIRAIVRDTRNTVGPSDDPGPAGYVLAGWRAAMSASHPAARRADKDGAAVDVGSLIGLLAPGHNDWDLS